MNKKWDQLMHSEFYDNLSFGPVVTDLVKVGLLTLAQRPSRDRTQV